MYSGDVELTEWTGGSDGSKALWKGNNGLSVERWGFWKQRLRYAAGLKRRGFAGRVVDDVVMWTREAGKMVHVVEQENAIAFDGLREVFDRDGVSRP